MLALWLNYTHACIIASVPAAVNGSIHAGTRAQESGSEVSLCCSCVGVVAAAPAFLRQPLHGQSLPIGHGRGVSAGRRLHAPRPAAFLLPAPPPLPPLAGTSALPSLEGRFAWWRGGCGSHRRTAGKLRCLCCPASPPIHDAGRRCQLPAVSPGPEQTSAAKGLGPAAPASCCR